jgi:tetratricopeptide (TPR) repeat protein
VALITAAAGEYEPARDGFTEAMALAEELGDTALMVRVLSDRAVFQYYFFRLEDVVADGRRAQEASTLPSPPWVEGWRLRWMEQALCLLGRPVEASRIAERLEPLTDAVGQPDGVVDCVQMRAWVEFGKDFDLGRLEESLGHPLNVGRTAKPATSSVQPIDQMHWPSNVQPGGLAGLSLAQLSLVHFLRGEWDLASAEAEEAYQSSFPSAGQGTIVGALFRQRAYLGNRSGALGLLDEAHGVLPSAGRPNTGGAWNMLVLVIEGLTVLGERQKAAALYHLVLELLATGAVWLWTAPRFVRTVAGVAAAAAGEWTVAEHHFEVALQQAEMFPNRLEQVDIRRFRAMMLLDRGAGADRATARSLLDEAGESYARFGMPRHHELTDRLLTASAA